MMIKILTSLYFNTAPNTLGQIRSHADGAPARAGVCDADPTAIFLRRASSFVTSSGSSCWPDAAAMKRGGGFLPLESPAARRPAGQRECS